MTLPASFARDGFKSIGKNRGILIGTEGGANAGKTEFSWSAPGPGIQHAIDRGYRAALENQTPPASRNLIDGDNLIVLLANSALNTGCTKEEALASWKLWYRESYLKSLANPDARTIIIDGDSDSFEWQMMAEFGRTTQIPQIQRTSLNAARRVMIARAWDSKKIVIMTNKLKKKYEEQWNPDGSPKMGDDGKQKRDWDGKSYERQGFPDHEYLYEIQLRHLYRRAGIRMVKGKEVEVPQQWGIQLLMVKANRNLEGDELWGDDCNMPTLLEYVYPHVPLKEWGY